MPTDPELTAEIVRAWDRGASTYDETPRHGLRHPDEWRAWRRFLAALLGDPRHSGLAPRRVLDVGTGTGVVALLAAELGHDVTGVDLSEAMLDRARRKSADAGLAIEWVVANAEALPPALVGYDVVIARHVLWTLPHPEAAVRAWRDAATAAGLVVVVDGFDRLPPWPLDVGQAALRTVAARLRRPSDGGDHAYAPHVRERLPLARQRDTAAVSAILRAAGLEHVRVRPMREIDRVERRHQPVLDRLGDSWRRYVATGRTPVLTSTPRPATER